LDIPPINTDTEGKDIRDEILKCVIKKTVIARILAVDQGIVVGTAKAENRAKSLGLKMRHIVKEGQLVKPGDEIALFEGRPKQILTAEEQLIGLMAKSSGIATMARQFVDRAGQRTRIVSGAWKKMPLDQKKSIQRAVVCGGANCRISNSPFLYLDKNYVRILGGIRTCLQAVAGFKDYLKVVQIWGEFSPIGIEAAEAVEHGADIIFIDSGKIDDLAVAVDKLKKTGFRARVKIAFGGNIQLQDIEDLKAMDVDILDIGRPIIDAPLLDMRMEVIDVSS
jgi:nicotinate-nucleotide pyrophosphorylase (carboxylating)